jgi:hypothetical protein
MTRRLGLLVTDASPLITLGAADALSCLTLPGVQVLIPDMVYAEVVQDMARLGAREVVRWAREHFDQVRIVPTETFTEFQALRNLDPATKSKGRGEQSALEVLNEALATDETTEAILLYEDNDILRRRFVRAIPDRVTALSTGDFLHELEAAGLIQSSDRILNVAAARGRNVEGQRAPSVEDEARALLRQHLQRRREGPDLGR